MPTVVELKQSRESLIVSARELIEQAETADRDFTSDEKTRYDQLDTDIRAYTDRIGRQEADEQRARDLATPSSPRGGDREAHDELAGQFRELANGDRRSLTVDFTERDITTATDAVGGGYTIPTTFVARLYEYLTEASAIRRTNVNTFTTAGGEPMLIPKVTGKSTAGWVGEGSAIPESDPSFGQVELGAYKAGQFIQISPELVADTAVNILNFIARDAGTALGELTGDAYLNGTGPGSPGQPTGIIGDTTAGRTAETAGGTTITLADLQALFFSVIDPYRRRGSWMMNDATVAHLAAKTDSDGYPLLARDWTANVGFQLMGRPVVVDHNMPDMALNATPVLFGDFSAYYIRDVGQMRFERSEHYAFNSDLISFRSLMRTDGKLVDDTGAVKHLLMPSA